MLKLSYSKKVVIINKNVMYYKSIYYVLLLVIFGIFGYVFLDSGFNTKTRVKVEYEDNSEVFYKVNYLDNDYEINSDSGRYITSMVDTIDFNYNYNNLISEYINGYYKYSVDANLIAYEDDINNSLWEREYNIVKENTVILDANKINSINIKDSFKLDYSKYRNEILEFINVYNIDLNGYLQIKINIEEILNFKSLNNEYEDNKVITINVPLTDDTFKIDVNNIGSKSNCYEFTRDKAMNIVFLVIGTFCFSVSVALLILVIRQFRVICDTQNEYNKKLKKILSKYENCIVRVKRFYVKKKYNMIYVDSFDELLDVYDKKNKMISFKEIKRGSESIFVIIDDDDAWIYKLQ